MEGENWPPTLNRDIELRLIALDRPKRWGRQVTSWWEQVCAGLRALTKLHVFITVKAPSLSMREVK